MKIVNVLISDSWGKIDPDILEKGVGGREGAMLYLSREWAKQGHEVTNFVNTDSATRIQESGYHEYIPIESARTILTSFPYDVIIAWECPALFEVPVQAKLKICEMQVCHFSENQREAAEKYCDFVAALSPWHREFLIHDGLEMFDDSQVVVFPNGVDILRYPKFKISPKIESGKIEGPNFIYSSSPDRGLLHILESWPYIRKSFPDATLTVTYGVDKWVSHLKWSHQKQGEMAVDIQQLMNQPGVRDLGKVGQGQLSKLQIDADAWLYPLDAINATESGCITAVENAAAGNPIITTDCDCMETEFGEVGVVYCLPFDAKGYAECVEFVLSDSALVKSLRKDARVFAEGRDWSIIADSWIQFFNKELNA